MSVNYKAILAMGVPVIEKDAIIKGIMMFDEHTGKSYITDKKELAFFIENTNIRIDVNSDDKNIIWLDDKRFILGMPMHTAEDSSYVKVEPCNFEWFATKVKIKLKKRYKIDIEPSIYLIQYDS